MDDRMSAQTHLDSPQTGPKSNASNLTHIKGPVAGFILCALVLWAIVSLPSVIYSRLFPLDEGFLFHTGENLRSSLHWIVSPYNGTGRLYPFYLLYHAALFQAFGANVGPYLLVQSILFLAAVILTCWMLHRMTAVRGYAFALLLLIFTSSPIAENLNTIGKAEPLSYFFLVVIIGIFFRAQLRGTIVHWWEGACIIFLFSLAIWTKETSVVLIGFAMFGACLGLLFWCVSNDPRSLLSVRQYGALLGYLIIAICVTKLPYVISQKTTTAASYTEYGITTKLVRDNFYFYVTQQPDVLFFGLVSLLLVIPTVKSLKRRNDSESRTKHSLLLACSACAMAWAYYLALMTWRWPMGYYMLIPAAVFRLSALYALFELRHTGAFRHKWPRRSVCGVMVLLSIYSALGLYYIAYSQIAYSRIYTEALDKYKQFAQGKQNLVIESYPFYAEQIEATGILLDLRAPMTDRVKGIADLLDPSTLNPELIKILQITDKQIEQNTESLPRKGDLLLVFTGSKLATWVLRGVTPYFTDDSLLRKQNAYDLQLIAEDSINNPAVFIHTWTGRPKSGTTYLGYKLYRVLDDEPYFLWKNRYPDGWIGNHASLQVNKEYRGPIVIKMSAPGFAMPNRVEITKDGALFKTIEFTDTNEKTVELGNADGRRTLFGFEVQRAMAPKSLNLNEDKRNLGLRIELVQQPMAHN